MKKISILIPCYNEEDNVVPLSEQLVKIFDTELASYDYEIIFIDNSSTDNTRGLLRDICGKNCRIKAIFNAKNFGPASSGFYGLCQTTGDCTIGLAADFQDPPEIIPVLVREWEAGYKIVTAIKTRSRESRLMRFVRTCYYKLIKRMSKVEQLEHFSGFALYDKSFIDVVKNLRDPLLYFRGVISELGFGRKEISYTQQKRRSGKSSYSLYAYFDYAMLAFTSYTKTGLRFATISGFLMGGLTLLVSAAYFVYKLLYWDTFSPGIAPLVIGVFFLGSMQLFFIGFIGEYVMAINARLRLRDYPLVVEEERVNF
jgi:glycosyltransferase involved in cell wall biosynthesis